MKRGIKTKVRSPVEKDGDIGMRIRLRRSEIGMSQQELGAALGISFQQIQKYEKGVNRVGAARLQQIATALDTPTTFFLEEKSSSQTEVESLLFLDAPFTLRLLRAYSSISDQLVQRRLVSLVEAFAGHAEA